MKLIKLLPLFLGIALSGCQATAAIETTTAASTAPVTTAAYTTTALVPAGKYTVPDLTFEKQELVMNDALKFVGDMKLGWNLGNTFDANDDKPYNADTELNYEKNWNGHLTTEDMIKNLKAAGFNTVRLPNSWHNHLTDENFTISAAWLDRYQEVVDYVIDNDMYCIINIHHDDEPGFYYPNSENLESSKKYVTAIWQQLCERFKDYGDKLIFESINEPRLKGTPQEWKTLNPNEETELDSLKAIMELNQVFVDVVRASGGNNATRYLMCPSYDASADNAILPAFELPTDTADNRIIVSVHAYTPWNFALAPNGTSSKADFDALSDKDTYDIDRFMKGLYDKYTSKGIPVLIGEFGARDRAINVQDRINFAAYYIGTARSYGISCCWWDNNAFFGSGENFGLLDRATNTFKWNDLVYALSKYA
jgi:endoglucanase